MIKFHYHTVSYWVTISSHFHCKTGIENTKSINKSVNTLYLWSLDLVQATSSSPLKLNDCVSLNDPDSCEIKLLISSCVTLWIISWSSASYRDLWPNSYYSSSSCNRESFTSSVSSGFSFTSISGNSFFNK